MVNTEICIEINCIENGFILSDSFFGDETFYKNFDDAKKATVKILNKYKKESVYF